MKVAFKMLSEDAMDSHTYAKTYSPENKQKDVTRQTDIQIKVAALRAELIKDFPFIHRIALAIYDADRDVLQTYSYDEETPSNLCNYEAVLSDCTSLHKLSQCGQERVINDISVFDNGKHEHSKLIRKAGYQASYTMPLIVEDQLVGFFFANSKQKNVLHGEVIKRLRLIAMVLTLLLARDLSRLEVLKSTVESIKMMSHHRDPETGEHLSRMSSYSLLIARQLAEKYQLTDVQIGYIYLYAPLHDVGKLMVPDSILLKKGALSDKEFERMKQHTVAGSDLADKLINVYQLSNMPHMSMLSNIIRNHHEKLDGSGYPDGLEGDEIPIEARIVAVADIFDALTSERPYKKAWSNEQAFMELEQQANFTLDADCVAALYSNQDKIQRIQHSFIDHY